MPEYTFNCNVKKGGCGHCFVLWMRMSEYSPNQKCPKCQSTLPIVRDFLADLPQSIVRKGDDEITVGQLAERNTKKMGADQRNELTKKHNAYKHTEPTKELSKGERIASTKQRKHDPKRGKRKKKE